MKYIFVFYCLMLAYSFSYGQNELIMKKIEGNYKYCKVERFAYDEDGDYDIGDGDIYQEYVFYDSGALKESIHYFITCMVNKYDEAGNHILMRSTKDDEVRIEMLSYYDTLNNCIANTIYRPWVSSDIDSVYLNIKYNDSGKVIEKNISMNTEAGWENNDDNQVRRAYLSYDEKGRLIKEEVFNDKHQLFSKKLIEYNEAGLESKITTDKTVQFKYYDKNGNLEKHTSKDKNGSILMRILYKYNDRNQIIEYKIFSKNDFFKQEGYMEKYFYNEEGNLSKILKFGRGLEQPTNVEFLTYYKEYIPED